MSENPTEEAHWRKSRFVGWSLVGFVQFQSYFFPLNCINPKCQVYSYVKMLVLSAGLWIIGFPTICLIITNENVLRQLKDLIPLLLGY